MPRIRVKTSERGLKKDLYEKACKDVLKGMSIRGAAKEYGINNVTLVTIGHQIKLMSCFITVPFNMSQFTPLKKWFMLEHCFEIHIHTVMCFALYCSRYLNEYDL